MFPLSEAGRSQVRNALLANRLRARSGHQLYGTGRLALARDNTGFQCHSHDAMVSYELHHVWPLKYHGPNVKANLVKICPNAHSDAHYLMERMLAGKPYNLREYGPAVRAIAQRGYDAVTAYADSLAATIEGTTDA